MTSAERVDGMKLPLRTQIIEQQAKGYFDREVRKGSQTSVQYLVNRDEYVLFVTYDDGVTTTGIEVPLGDIDTSLTIEEFEVKYFGPAAAELRTKLE